MQERELHPGSGWSMLAVTIGTYLAAAFGIYAMIKLASAPPFGYGLEHLVGWFILIDVLIWLAAGLLSGGFFVVEPNGSKVVLLFGKYQGTVKESGFYWANPFYGKRLVSLRARTLHGQTIKVNDLSGNPVEIAAVVVWRVRDTFMASFEVNDFESYVGTQSETAVRHLASSYPYDADEETLSLRRNTDELSVHLRDELQERLNMAGVEVMEARLSHLAYAAEIAGAMLRRQQATAVIAARQRIVEGAVGMVEMALQRLEGGNTVTLDDERKAAMVSNLMVVLCSEHAAQPVLNTGTLYN